jgi:hypothetical protein
MKNVTVSSKGNILTITVDCSKVYGLSASGKTVSIASTEGNQNMQVGDYMVCVGLNVYTKDKDRLNK